LLKQKQDNIIQGKWVIWDYSPQRNIDDDFKLQAVFTKKRGGQQTWTLDG
jgi:hypothetical protein